LDGIARGPLPVPDSGERPTPLTLDEPTGLYAQVSARCSGEACR
jgi:hypothetical protein